MNPPPLRPVLRCLPLVLLAAAGPVRTGADAFGNWRGDAPGVRRMIRPGDLPPPYATRSESNGPSVAARPAGVLPQVPPGFRAQLWASGLDMPRSLRVAPDGAVVLAESGAGRVLLFRPGPDGAASGRQVLAEGLEQPFGLAFWPPGPQPRYLYIGETNRVVRVPWPPAAGRPARPEVIVPRLPEGGHWTRDLAASPDGRRLFVSVGSASNVAAGMRTPPGGAAAWDAAHGTGAPWGAEAGRAEVLSFAPDGSDGHVTATGLRNCVGMTVQPGAAPAGGRLWCVVNERDGLGDNLPPDYATPVAEGGFYGWPWYYIGAHEDPRHRGERLDLAGRETVPEVLLQAHSAPLGIAFYPPDGPEGGGGFPAEYRGDAFVALHGSWNRGQRTGYKVVRLPMRDGMPTGEYEDFLTGFVAGDGDVWGRPVGVAVARDGALLVSEDGNGTIWRVTH